jgi:electron-transferring-flavoprotein dehydrogenase
MPQVFETGIEEVIQLPEDNYFKTSKGNDIHLLGYPLELNTPGGGFIYGMNHNQVTLGYLTGLCYRDPMKDLYHNYIKFKQHPFVANIIKNGKVIEQGARAVCTGGLYTMPQLAVDGALFVGGSASMMNMPGLKGIHVCMESGMLAAESIIQALEKDSFTAESLETYQQLFEKSWAKEEMFKGRNFYQSLAKNPALKFFLLGTQYITGGRGMMESMPLEEDCLTLKPVKGNGDGLGSDFDQKIYDGVLYVDKLTGVYLSKTKHREDQPSHILVHDTQLCVTECYDTYRSPCTRFCPGDVYEIEIDENTAQRRLKLNPSNCLHCKTCDIKDPYRNITWTCPEGGDGPGYTML